MVKVTVSEGKAGYEYPKLMKSRAGALVLFCEEGKGVVVGCGDESYQVGWFGGAWFMDAFSDFQGTVTLSSGG